MQTDKMKVLLYLKKSGLDRSGQAPIMGAYNLWANHRPVQLQALVRPQAVECS